MTQKTIHKRARRKFDMAVITDRLKKRHRSKFGKKIDRSKIREVWKDWVEIMIIEPLLSKGKVKLDAGCTLEVVCTKAIHRKGAKNLYMNGNLIGVPNRKGEVYWIKMTDTNFKDGVLMFEPSQRIKDKLKEILVNTNKYYRTEDGNQ